MVDVSFPQVIVEDAQDVSLKEVRPSRDLQSKSSRDTPGTTLWKQALRQEKGKKAHLYVTRL